MKEKAIALPITFHMESFGGKVVLCDIKGRMGFTFPNHDSIIDCVLDTNFDMHIEETYKGMEKGIDVMLEWYDGNDIACSRHKIDRLLNSETMEEELKEGFKKVFPILEECQKMQEEYNKSYYDDL